MWTLILVQNTARYLQQPEAKSLDVIWNRTKSTLKLPTGIKLKNS